MKHTCRTDRWIAFATVGAVTATVAACGPSKPAPLPPPPPPQVVIPPQPRPPLGAPSGMAIPPINAMGVRQTINTGVGPDQLLWNFRSAYNVAALNCLNAQHAAILDNYKSFLQVYAKALANANKGVDKQFAVAKGKANIRAREAYMTQVYNFYALPPTLPQFCDAVLAISSDLQNLPTTPGKAPPRRKGKPAAQAIPIGSEPALRDFAATNLPKLDRVFFDFFTSYDQYRADLAAWRQRYAPETPAPAVVPLGTTAPVTPAPATLATPIPAPAN